MHRAKADVRVGIVVAEEGRACQTGRFASPLSTASAGDTARVHVQGLERECPLRGRQETAEPGTVATTTQLVREGCYYG